MNDFEHSYARLTPDLILAAVEHYGYACNGHLLALNSYENRVYQIGLEDGAFLVAKFYRPERWSDEAILEEHAFAQELVDHQIPVVAPLSQQGETLHEQAGFRFAIFPRRGGRWPELDDPDKLLWLGRYLGRLHRVAQSQPFLHRPALTIDSFGTQSVEYLLTRDFLPGHLLPAYETLCRDLLEQIASAYQRAGQIKLIRTHGDCHPGNILWTDHGPHFVDLDDCRMAPAIQDLWMLLSGNHQEQSKALNEILEGYREFSDFDARELHLIEALRTLRMMHYAAWLARRRDDPAFQQAFPWFGTDKYWEEHILSLREQAAALNEPTLSIM